MHIEILKFRHSNVNAPAFYHYKNDKVNKLFRRVSENKTQDGANKKATVYLCDKTAVLKIETENGNSTDLDIREFNFSINLHVESNALAIYTLFSQESRVSEGILFSRQINKIEKMAVP